VCLGEIRASSFASATDEIEMLTAVSCATHQEDKGGMRMSLPRAHTSLRNRSSGNISAESKHAITSNKIQTQSSTD
jgi:hypothetical protein